MNWSAEQYLQFGGQRLRPALDLIAAVDLSAPRRVVDLGCGPGNATNMLRQRWPDCELTGLDNDPAMLVKARRWLHAVSISASLHGGQGSIKAV